MTRLRLWLTLFGAVTLAGVSLAWTADTPTETDSSRIITKGPSAVTADSTAAKMEKSDSVYTVANGTVVYYFHGTKRCPTCIKLEAYSKEAIDSGFPDALKARTLQWQVVNWDQPENEHFLKDYELYTKSVVLVEMKDGQQAKWKNLEKIWELVGDKGAFVKYIRDEVKAFAGSE